MTMSKLLTAGVLFMLALAPMRAQSNGFLRVQIPFSFVAAGKELPAGEYTIQQTSESGIVIIHGVSEGRTVALHTMFVWSSRLEEPGAKFTTVAGQKYLDQIEMPDGTVRALLPHSAK
jgi:hypothetical protein